MLSIDYVLDEAESIAMMLIYAATWKTHLWIAYSSKTERVLLEKKETESR